MTRTVVCVPFEKAYRAGQTEFVKPISCALYPIREKQFAPNLYGLNYHRWKICAPGRKKGEELGLPLYRFLEGPSPVALARRGMRNCAV